MRLALLGATGGIGGHLLAWALARAGVRRLINVSAGGAFITGDPDTGALTKAILPRILAAAFADLREMEAAIRASDPELDPGPRDPAGRPPGHGPLPGPGRLPAGRRPADRPRGRRPLHGPRPGGGRLAPLCPALAY